MMVNHFVIAWPLILAGLVDRILDASKKEKWQGIFVGDAAFVMGDIIVGMGWDEKGYPMNIPDNPNETPTLRIAEYTKDDKNGGRSPWMIGTRT